MKLAAADYSLGAPDFARPALTQPQRHSLKAADFSVQALDFDALTLTHKHSIPVGGRPRLIPDTTKPVLIAAMENWLRTERLASSRPVFQKDTRAMNYARELVTKAGLVVSDTVLRRQIIKPAFRNVGRYTAGGS